MLANEPETAPGAANDAPLPSGLDVPPGPGGVLRNFLRRVTDYPMMLDELHSEYGDIVYFRIPFARFCVLYSPELIKELLVSREEQFPTVRFDLQSDMIRHGTMQMVQGEDRCRRRAVMDPKFTEDALDTWTDILIEEANSLRDRCRPGATVDMKMEAGTFVWAVMSRAMIDRDINIPYSRARDMVAHIRTHMLLQILPFSSWLEKLPLPVFRRGKPVIDEMDRWIKQAARRARAPGAGGDDLVTHLVRAVDDGVADWTYENDEALRDEVLLMHAFVDAPLSALALGLAYLSRNPQVREKLEREVDEVLGDRPLALSDYPGLTYTRAIGKELLRIDPPTYVSLPKIAGQDLAIGGYRIPKGTMVHSGARTVHRSAEYWGDPLEFRPERWLEKPPPPCAPHAYVPYGSGSHACVGSGFASRMFVFALATLAQSRRLDLKPDRMPRISNVGAIIREDTVPMAVSARP